MITESTDRLAQFVESLAFDQVPPLVVTRTKEVLYDGTGALLSATASRYNMGVLVHRFVGETGGVPECQVFGTPLRTNCETASLVNGAFAYHSDSEANHPGAIMHAIAVVGPAALAVGESRRSSGRDVLTAIVVGIDVACRVSIALNPAELYARGFHPTSVAGAFGAMAAASRLYGLTGKALRNAFGLAGLQASGLLAWVDDPTEHSRPFNVGFASRNGVLAAKLASCGVGGPPAIFGQKYPFGRAFSGQWNEEALFKGLGEHFMVMDLCFKPYACCAFTHPGLDGLLDIQKSEGVLAADIKKIILRFPAAGYKVIDNNALRSHCAQYVLALAATRGYVDFYDVLHDQREDPQMRSLSSRIEVVGDDDLDRTYPKFYRSVVEVTTHGGHHYSRDIKHPRGSPENPMSRAELQDKFCALTKDVLTDSQAKAISAAIDDIENLDEISFLTRLLGRENLYCAPSHSASTGTSV